MEPLEPPELPKPAYQSSSPLAYARDDVWHTAITSFRGHTRHRFTSTMMAGPSNSTRTPPKMTLQLCRIQSSKLSLVNQILQALSPISLAVWT